VNVLVVAAIAVVVVILMQMSERRDRNPLAVIAGMGVVAFWVAVAAERFGWTF
jgi:FtsH-binding integral membrane protein